MIITIKSEAAKDKIRKLFGAISIRFRALNTQGPINLRYGSVVEEFASVLEKRTMGSMGFLSYTSSDVSGINVGRYCSIASSVRVMGDKHPIDWLTTHPCLYVETFQERMRQRGIYYELREFDKNQPQVHVGNDVWIGANVTIKGGVNIGNGAIVAAHSVVTKNVPPYAIVAGIPAKVIRMRFDSETIKDLLNSNWWEYNILKFAHLEYKNPTLFLEQLQKLNPEKEHIASIMIDYQWLLKCAPGPEKPNERADYLRDTAVQIDKIDVVGAAKLMEAAREIRPNGPLIINKLREYTRKFTE